MSKDASSSQEKSGREIRKLSLERLQIFEAARTREVKEEAKGKISAEVKKSPETKATESFPKKPTISIPPLRFKEEAEQPTIYNIPKDFNIFQSQIKALKNYIREHGINNPYDKTDENKSIITFNLEYRIELTKEDELLFFEGDIKVEDSTAIEPETLEVIEVKNGKKKIKETKIQDTVIYKDTQKKILDIFFQNLEDYLGKEIVKDEIQWENLRCATPLFPTAATSAAPSPGRSTPPITSFVKSLSEPALHQENTPKITSGKPPLPTISQRELFKQELERKLAAAVNLDRSPKTQNFSPAAAIESDSENHASNKVRISLESANKELVLKINFPDQEKMHPAINALFKYHSFSSNAKSDVGNNCLTINLNNLDKNKSIIFANEIERDYFFSAFAEGYRFFTKSESGLINKTYKLDLNLLRFKEGSDSIETVFDSDKLFAPSTQNISSVTSSSFVPSKQTEKQP